MTLSPLQLAFALAPRLPLGLVMWLARAGAGIAARCGGSAVTRMRSNIARLTGTQPSDALVRAAVVSHIRNYGEQLMLGSPRGACLLEGVTFEGFEELTAATHDGPVVLALGHSGSWDRAGAWVCSQGYDVVTVAEKVEPAALFERFVALREGLGMEIIGVARGESVFSALVERVRSRHVIVPLLADRDISGAGIEVTLGGGRALVAAGPAALATRLDRPLLVAIQTKQEYNGNGGHVRASPVRGRSMRGRIDVDRHREPVLVGRAGWSGLPYQGPRAQVSFARTRCPGPHALVVP